VPGWLRGLVLKRDERRCKSCQGIDDLQVDHIVPCAVGGRADEWNLQVLCRPCNNDKGGDWYPGCIWEKVRTDLCDYYFLIAPRWFRQPDLDNFLWERNAYQRTGTWTPLIHKIFAPPRGVVTKRRPALSMLFDFEVDELLSCYENWPPAVAGQP
jgi:hypothetical protein